MKLRFSKYHGTGNDFILIDNRKLSFPAGDEILISQLCDRRFGIGADGMILLQEHPNLDFEMRYFNSDGKEATMCGNGGRCVVHFAHSLKIISDRTFFQASDGTHQAIINNGISLEMSPVSKIKQFADSSIFLDTGSPHLVIFVDDTEKFDIISEGRKYRYDKKISDAGVNVNFASMADEGGIVLRTYERGVEDETWSCGTGAVATALAASVRQNLKPGKHSYQVQAKGGRLDVFFEKTGNTTFTNIILKGPAEMVYSGEMTI